jgi:hypothetical protein
MMFAFFAYAISEKVDTPNVLAYLTLAAGLLGVDVTKHIVAKTPTDQDDK